MGELLKIVKPSTEAEKATRTTLDTLEVTPNIVKSWKLPSFQRPLQEKGKKMQEVIDGIKEDHIIPGILTIGLIRGSDHRYLIDGQHRRHAFLMAEIPSAYVDVRFAHYDSEAEMADEFKKVNKAIVTLKSDDILRAEEKSNKELARLRREFPWVGYGTPRRGANSPIISMSMLLRTWFGSAPEAPTTGGVSAADVVDDLTKDEVDTMLGFLELAQKAFGRENDTARLWSNPNLALCMWLYRRLVIAPYSANIKKMPRDLFLKCLMTVAAHGEYHDWLAGRSLRERDRSPTYNRLKSMFTKRMSEEDSGSKPRLPQPSWAGR